MFDNYQEISHTRGLSTVPFFGDLEKQIYCAELCCALLLIPRPLVGWLGRGGGCVATAIRLFHQLIPVDEHT